MRDQTHVGASVCEILRQNEVAPSIFRMELLAPEIASKCLPGQFVHMKVTEGLDPFWRRPFSIHRISKDKRNIGLVYRVIGRGTTNMKSFRAGDKACLLGPLGNPFKLSVKFDTAIIVAGGLGIAPVPFLLDRLAETGKKSVLLWGVRRSDELFGIDQLKQTVAEILPASEDGGTGFHGRVTDLLKDYLRKNSSFKNAAGFACGPMPMLRVLQGMVRGTGFGWQASIEEKMACGVGACQGCVVRIQGGGYQTVCADGPVFDLAELDFNG